MTYSMAPLHSLVDDLRFKNMSHHKEGGTLMLQYLKRLLNFYLHINDGWVQE